jgi:nudix-type nucleoside diphosphatase (YffH/AdpP family)
MKNEPRVEIISRKDLVNDFFRLEEAQIRYPLYNGKMSAPQRRLSLERGNSAAAVLYHQDLNAYILTEQFRYPTYPESGGWLLEIPAGRIEEDEPAEDCIRREIREETGMDVTTLKFLVDFYTSPGGSSERIFLFHATVTGQIGAGSKGNRHEAEDIQLLRMPEKKLKGLLKDGQIKDAKSIIGLQMALNGN